MARGFTQRQIVVNNKALPVGGNLTLNSEFEVSGFWRALHCVFEVTVTGTTHAGPIEDALLKLIKKITFKTSNGEYFINNAGARGLYYFGATDLGEYPSIDTLTAVVGTTKYRVNLPIYFSDPGGLRPDDTIFMADRYQSVSMEFACGVIGDLFSAPGDAVIDSINLDLVVERLFQSMPEPLQPKFQREIREYPAIDMLSQSYLDFERANNLALRRIVMMTTKDNTTGVPFGGTADHELIDTFDFKTSNLDVFNETKFNQIRDINRLDYDLITPIPGTAVIDFHLGHSIKESLDTGKTSVARFQFRPGVNFVGAANKYLNAVVSGLRPLIGAPQN